MKKIVSVSLVLFSVLIANAQQVGVGQWRDHLPYNNGLAVAPAVNRVYVAAGVGLFYYNLSDNTVTTLSKITGLSDIGVKVVRYNNEYKTLVVGYDNGNMDLIVNGTTIENYSDIKRTTSVLGKKTINNVMFIGPLAYISTNFGISVFDLEDKEFKETYIIGPNGNNLNINQTATDGTYIYAATDIGLFKANLSNPFLNDYNNWSVVTNIPNGTNKKINAVCYVANKLYANYSTDAYDNDSCFVFDGNTWAERDPSFHFDIRTLTSYNDKLIVTSRLGSLVWGPAATTLYSFDLISDPLLDPSEAMFDDLGNFWVADRKTGAKVSAGNLGTQTVTPIGPQQKSALNMVYNNGKLWVVPGGTIYYQSLYNAGQVSIYDGTQWNNLNGANDTVLANSFDYMSTAVDPTDPEHVYFTSWGKGLIEKKGNQYFRFRPDNSPIKILPGSGNLYFCAGAVFEPNGKLWFTNAFNPSGIMSRTPNGTITDYNMGSLLSAPNTFTSQIIIDSYNQKWVVLGRGGGILVFKDENGGIPASKRKVLTTAAGNGALPDIDVRVVVQDLEDQIWVGTAKGVCVFYSPDAVFSGSNFDAQKPGIVEGGFFYPLLENEKITCMAVDGANRKWIGTEKGGVFLISADGSQQIHNFNIENSPLLSNVIFSIAIDSKTGEVFIGTDEGIVSYRGDATEGGDEYDKVYAFPNPVRPNYSGPISIKGLVRDADVKITDIAGRVIYQTKANGGQATWNGNGFDGERAKSGVYLVFTTNSDGSQTNVTKIMVVN